MKLSEYSAYKKHQMKDFSYITNAHPSFIESLYNDYITDPNQVDPEYKKFFEGFDFAFSKIGTGSAGSASIQGDQLLKEFNVFSLIRAYRKRGHLIATTNPIRNRKDRSAKLSLSDYNLSEADLNTPFIAGKLLGMENASLKDIIEKLKKTYTSDVGIEYTYINDTDVCKWMEEHFENMMASNLSIEKKKRILEKLNEGVIFEKFLHTKYIGQKRFSLEGGESTIAALDTIINEAANNDVKEVVIGMAHRGRLNVLANTLRKTYEQIFSEFDGVMPPDTTMGSGDVKYHLGFRSQIHTPEGKEINVQLTPNPSHLEVVDPVVVGFARAKADTLYGHSYKAVLPILIHGDAAVAGQGVVYELLQMSKLPGYNTGGTIHFVINNQIGFTTDFDDARSADYCTSVAAMVQAPVLHVNGDDPEAVVKAAALAVAYRQQFNQDIFIDMVCYRRHGHNEGDDPSFTQPKMYELIKQHANPRELYNQQLIARGDVDAALAKEMEDSFWKNLQDRLDENKQKPLPYQLQAPEAAWQALRKANAADFDVSPISALRDLWTPIKLINSGVIVSYHAAGTMSINTSTGTLWGNGIGWTTDQLNPNSVQINGQSPVTFQYRTRSAGSTASNTTVIDNKYWDNAGVKTLIGNPGAQSTNQRVYLFPTGLVRIQLGQKVYGTLAEAVAGLQTEPFDEYQLNKNKLYKNEERHMEIRLSCINYIREEKEFFKTFIFKIKRP